MPTTFFLETSLVHVGVSEPLLEVITEFQIENWKKIQKDQVPGSINMVTDKSHVFLIITHACKMKKKCRK